MFICTPGLAGKTQNILNSGVSLLAFPLVRLFVRTNIFGIGAK